MSALSGILKSKKFVAMAIGALVIALGSLAGISEAESTKIAGLITGYVVSQGIADHGMASYGEKGEPAKEAE